MSSNEKNEREVDKDYLALLENKLKNLKDPNKTTAKKFLSDIATQKDHQLFRLLTAEPNDSLGFDDNFVVDQPIVPNYIQRKFAPQTCAVNKQELVKLVKSDLVDILHQEVDKLHVEEKTDRKELIERLKQEQTEELGKTENLQTCEKQKHEPEDIA